MGMKKYVITLLSKLGTRKPDTVTGAAASEVDSAVEATDVQSSALSSLLDVDTHRQRLAAGDPALNQALGGIELTLARQLGQQFRPADRRRS
ncbi:hypothetical protein [Saccharothrix texasensis]|uniref:Uncharacterized protein n=1 Tax=Saccharothrix texasensis TaxID=103734 RepID=A0A3N1H937_9PSEU|nr:hypothetical protein [Saccharothrix texasensis]ROP38988.1 hypothetical protein EDD40_4356 [Saccharothrix texasensis]